MRENLASLKTLERLKFFLSNGRECTRRQDNVNRMFVSLLHLHKSSFSLLKLVNRKPYYEDRDSRGVMVPRPSDIM
jgi:hypothetical protein